MPLTVPRLVRKKHALLRATNIPAAVALVLIVIAGIFAEVQNRRLHEQDRRAQVQADVSVVRAKLEGAINANIQLARGLISTLVTEPGMSQARFASLARNLLHSRSQLRLIAGAPDMVIALMYPMAGNESAIGLNYLHNAQQRDAVIRARDLRELVFAGPVDPVQGGGKAFVGRFPVYLDGKNGPDRFWGIVSAVIDAERLYADSGLHDLARDLDIAITGQDALGLNGVRFFGPEAALPRPVTASVLLPSGFWQIAAAPKGGWDATPSNAWTMRAFIFVAGALILIPMLTTGGLVEERQKHIADLHRSQGEMRRLSRRLGLALETSKVGVWEFNIDTGLLVWDDRMDELYGLPADGRERSYADWSRTLHADDLARAEADFDRAIKVAGQYDSEYRLVLPDGAVRHIRAIGAVYDDGEGGSQILGVNWDVTADVTLKDKLLFANAAAQARNVELEAAKSRIEHNSLHDSLTDLPNRRFLDQMLDDRTARGADAGERMALLHIDLDRFKQINDTLGHAAGDAMLVHAAAILRAGVRDDDFVARVGGDEFVVLCSLAGDDADISAQLVTLADRIIATMNEPVVYRGHPCRFGVSVGIARQLAPGDGPKRLMIDADIALYRAKSQGRGRYQFFNEALQTEIVRTKRVADDLLHALEHGEFTAFYQPQFDATTLDIIGVEALARWNHPAEGLLSPDAFLRTAEELNVVAGIDRIILETALADLKRWRAGGLAIPKISVNVSARRLYDEALIDSLQALDIEPGTVSFELVESIFLDDTDERIVTNVDAIKRMGIDVEIDDFGTGHASVVSLLKLKPRRLKVDRQLVEPVVRSRSGRQLVQSIVDIGQSLGIEVMAEGVETMNHAQILRKMGCHSLQGFALARPMSAADLAFFAKAKTWRMVS